MSVILNETRFGNDVPDISAIPTRRSGNTGHQRQVFVKKHPVDPHSPEHDDRIAKRPEGRPPFLGGLHNGAVSHTGLIFCLGPGIDPLEATTSPMHPIGHGQ